VLFIGTGLCCNVLSPASRAAMLLLTGAGLCCNVLLIGGLMAELPNI
jgi:hypothetical protein